MWNPDTQFTQSCTLLNRKNQIKNELMQISAIKLKILHSIQRLIMFDEKHEEINNILSEYFDLLQIKETFLREKIYVSVENFLKKIIFKNFCKKK